MREVIFETLQLNTVELNTVQFNAIQLPKIKSSKIELNPIQLLFIKLVRFISLLISAFVPSLLIQTANGGEYCVALRGNGERMPAHWGAMASLVQDRGLPQAMAGGSSASLTIFLLESLSLNKHLKTSTQQALAVKSFQGYFETLTQTSEGRAVAALLSDKDFLASFLAAADDLDRLKKNPDFFIQLRKHLVHIETLLQSQDFIDLVNPEFVDYVRTTLKWTQQLSAGVGASGSVTPEMVTYRKDQISKAIKNFGKFDAQTDETLFFRPGLISFSQLAKVIGRMGDYYAGVQLQNLAIQTQVEQDFKDFLKTCVLGTEKKSWRKINEENPLCRQLIGRSILTYLKTAQSEGKNSLRIQENVGDHLATFPATSVLVDGAVTRYQVAKQAYGNNEDITFGKGFLIDQEDLRFGYWGNEAHLSRVEKSLSSDYLTRDDAKSKKFLPLGNKIWLEALSTSPAEPGLANLLELDGGVISAGGWSDLHPTLILRAYGCEDIVYVTRKGGESMFAQGVIKKLTNLDGFDWSEWEGLTKEEQKEKNIVGNIHDLGPSATLWSQLYNMANSESSIRKSMKAATTTICTDWDNYDPRQDINALIEEAMDAYTPGVQTDCF